MIWYDKVSHSIWYGMVWYGMVWYGMVWYGMSGMVCQVWYAFCNVVGMVCIIEDGMVSFRLVIVQKNL